MHASLRGVWEILTGDPCLDFSVMKDILKALSAQAEFAEVILLFVILLVSLRIKHRGQVRLSIN